MKKVRKYEELVRHKRKQQERNTDNEVLSLVFPPEGAWTCIWVIYFGNWHHRKLGRLRHGKWKIQFNSLSFKLITTEGNWVLILLGRMLGGAIRMHQNIHKQWDRKVSILRYTLLLPVGQGLAHGLTNNSRYLPGSLASWILGSPGLWIKESQGQGAFDTWCG